MKTWYANCDYWKSTLRINNSDFGIISLNLKLKK